MVRMKGLEPSRLATLDPKSSVSTNSTTSAPNNKKNSRPIVEALVPEKLMDFVHQF